MARLFHALMLAVTLLSLEASAGSITLNASLHSYLSTYIPNATLGSASFYNLTLNHNTYVIMQLSTGANRFVVINTTGSYSVILNSSGISPLLNVFLIGKYYPNQSTLNYLNTSMHAYINQSKGPINDCLTETGLDQYTCTEDNACYSCQAIPICKSLMSHLGGPGSSSAAPFVNGIKNFSNQYISLNNSYNSYFSTLSSLSQSNIGASISSLSSEVSTISSTSTMMPQNPLFPLPSDYNLASLFSTCTGYSPTNQPWYCVDLGFCQSLSFNSVLLYNIQSVVAQLQASPISSTGLASVSSNSSSIARRYVMAVVSREQNASFSAFINASEPEYNTIVLESQVLLSMFSNESLGTALHTLESTFNTVISTGPSQNMIASNALFANALSVAATAYSAAYSAFSPVYELAHKNNYLIAVAQLSYTHMPASLAKLALEQQAINAMINSGLNESQLSSVLQQMNVIGASLSTLRPFSLGSLVKSIDGSITNMLLAGAAPISSKNANAALYASAISLVIGGAILLLFYVFVYHRMKSKHKIKLHSRAKRAWRMLFIVFGIVVAAYALATYEAASGANTLLPVSGFVSAVKASKSLAIVLNTTESSALSCSGSIQASLSNMSKTVYVIGIVERHVLKREPELQRSMPGKSGG